MLTENDVLYFNNLFFVINRPPTISKKPLPKMCYDAMSDRQLKDNLRKHNLPVKGSKKVLIRLLLNFILFNE